MKRIAWVGVAVVGLFLAATFGPHVRPWIAGFAEVYEELDEPDEW